MTESAVNLPISEEPLPGQDPLTRKSPLYLTFYTLAVMVGGVSSVSIKQVILPLQVSMIDPVTTNLSFTLERCS